LKATAYQAVGTGFEKTGNSLESARATLQATTPKLKPKAKTKSLNLPLSRKIESEDSNFKM
jgi:hypothetical protein